MKSKKIKSGGLICFGILFIAGLVCAQNTPSTGASGDSILLTADGKVDAAPAGTMNWQPGHTNQVLQTGDRLRTGLRSRATVRLSNLTVLRVNQLTTLQILPPSSPDKQSLLSLEKGAAYFFSRDRPTEMNFRTPLVSAAIRGTEFNLAVDDDGKTIVTLIDGEVTLTNKNGGLDLVSGEQGIVEPGQAPRKTAVINAINIIQWCLYYPAVLNLDDLPFTDVEKQALAPSLDAYRSGDLLAALAGYPTNRAGISGSEKIYYAELLLSAGQVDQADLELKALPPDKQTEPLAESLQTLIAAVKHESISMVLPSRSTELMAASYYEQSHSQGDESLKGALDLARRATQVSPQFGFAWERVAELEFSFGHRDAAIEALDRSLQLSPNNAQALALKGFLLAAQNKSIAAREFFDNSIAVDGSLGNAWLGRGLVRIHQGDTDGGLKDLQVAATLEPNRSLLRSYLGKAFANKNDDARAEKELKLARKIDPNDPTSWLYLALLDQQENKVNDAIGDLQHSQALNDNRSLFRSKLLLDQDRAVGSANLASIYRDAGMNDVSVREAASAVNDDYANASAHLYLSDAYNDLRDPTQFNLRYETVWFNELLLANLLSPVGGGRLSQEVSQQEYSKMFQQNGVGLASSTDARSDGMYHEQASQYGTYGNTGYAFDLDYHHNDGIRVNNGLDDLEFDTTIKQQVTPHDTALALVQYQNYHSGDNFDYYNPANARPNYKFDEYQHPILVGGWDHEWSPGIRTLALVGRLTDEQNFSDKAAPQLVLDELPDNTIYGVQSVPYDVDYHNQFTIYSAELNQLCEWDRVTMSVGARYQSGTFQADDQLFNASPAFLFTPTANSISANFERITGYSYVTVELLKRLWLTGGFAYDQVTYPDNYRQPPVASGEDKRSQLGPKAALVWNPIQPITLRGVYTRSLGGVSLDESYRLEPTQLAGFPQAFRSLISESIIGSVSAPVYETVGAALDLKLGPHTFAGIQAERLTTEVQRNIGDFVLQNGVSPGVTPEALDYKEYVLAASINQLVGDKFVLGASYSITRADLDDVLSAIPVSVFSTADQTERSTLQQAETYLQFNHPSGFFARAEAHWYGQANSGWTPAEPGDRFFQYNLFAGWFFAHRRAELELGILNLTGQNYHLNPLTVYQGLPTSRVFEAKLNFIF
ncbi:MAG TPA: FecR domain-containing protein [Verrucomicrobiae bacterium]